MKDQHHNVGAGYSADLQIHSTTIILKQEHSQSVTPPEGQGLDHRCPAGF